MKININFHLLILILGFIAVMSIIIFAYSIIKIDQVTERTKYCSDNNMTYIHITNLEGLPANIDYCGNMEDIWNILKEKSK